MSNRISWAVSISGIIQMVEAWIGIGVVITVWHYILDILWNSDLLDYIHWTFQDLVYFFGSKFSALFLSCFIWIILIYLARWAISWSSTNWGQTPNNKWN